MTLNQDQLDTSPAPPSVQNAAGDPRPRSLRDVPAWVWLWLPLVVLLVPHLARPFLDKPAYGSMVYGEFGLVENLTVIFLIIACVLGVRIFRGRDIFPSPTVRWWCLLLALGCFYMAGEEISWGQHFVGWGTPEAWSAMGPEQNETNLHNMFRIFNDHPRVLLAILIVLGSAIGPLYFKVKGLKFNPASASYWFWPTAVSILAGVLSIAVTLPRRIARKALDTELPEILKINAEESQEVFFALFLMIYLYSIYVRAQSYKSNLESKAA